MKKSQLPPWKQKLNEKIRKSNEMAEQFRTMGIECTVDESGDLCIEGSEFQKAVNKGEVTQP